MSITSNAKSKLAENSAELLELLQGLGVNVGVLETETPTYKAIADNDKLCKKRWQQRNRAKCYAYARKYLDSEKGKAAMRAIYQSEEYKAKKKEYRAANKDRIAARSSEYYAANKDRIAARSSEYYAANKDRIQARRRELYAANKDRIQARRRELYAQKRSILLDCRGKNNPEPA